MTLQQPRRPVDEKREENAIGFGRVEGAFDRAPGGGLVTERVPGDRLQEER
ncbi:MAG TPA: hypothetical protein VF070_22040 [Streptosporangiaceae bacterium]